MQKLFRHLAVMALAASLAAGPSMTAMAAPDDSNTGPAFANKVSQEAPGADYTTGPGAITGPGESAGASAGQTGSGQSGTADPSGAGAADQAGTAGADQSGTAAADQTGTDAGQAQEAPPILTTETTNQAFFQIQLLKSDLTWTTPVTGDSVIEPGPDGFLSMSIYINNLPGDVLYRTYSSYTGWTQWAMNGGHTAWNLGFPVEAVQIRFNGVFGDQFDIYYTSRLNDGTQCSWSKNGATNGTMNTGKFITGLRLSMWGKNVAGASYDLSSPLVAAAADGIQFVNGMPFYSSGNGQPFTGWAWNDRDRYYFVNNNPVVGWQYIDGYKYYFEADGKLVQDLEPYLGNAGPFMIRINKAMNCTTIYMKDGDNGYIIPFKSFLCSTGDDTPLGDHVTPEKYRWRLMVTDEYCQYLTRLGPGLSILLHSVIYERPDPYTLKPDTYNWLGATKSHGCIRFTTADAKWIYDHCPVGTTINVYESTIPGPFDRPAIKVMIPTTQRWDPTDPTVPENGLAQ